MTLGEDTQGFGDAIRSYVHKPIHVFMCAMTAQEFHT